MIALAFSNDGRTLASASSDRSVVVLWDVVRRTRLATFTGHSAQVRDSRSAPTAAPWPAPATTNPLCCGTSTRGRSRSASAGRSPGTSPRRNGRSSSVRARITRHAERLTGPRPCTAQPLHQHLFDPCANDPGCDVVHMRSQPSGKRRLVGIFIDRLSPVAWQPHTAIRGQDHEQGLVRHRFVPRPRPRLRRGRPVPRRQGGRGRPEQPEASTIWSPPTATRCSRWRWT